MATDCIPQVTFDFQGVRQPIVARFDQAHASSDGGALLLKAIDERLGLTQRLAACLTDRRQAGKVEHALIELVRQRVFGIACGYADCNDAARLGHDPVHKLLLERDPLAGPALASQPTLSRFENAVGWPELYLTSVALADLVIEHHRARLTGRAGGSRSTSIRPTTPPTGNRNSVALGRDWSLPHQPVKGTRPRGGEAGSPCPVVPSRVGPGRNSGLAAASLSRGPTAPRSSPRGLGLGPPWSTGRSDAAHDLLGRGRLPVGSHPGRVDEQHLRLGDPAVASQHAYEPAEPLEDGALADVVGGGYLEEVVERDFQRLHGRPARDRQEVACRGQLDEAQPGDLREESAWPNQDDPEARAAPRRHPRASSRGCRPPGHRSRVRWPARDRDGPRPAASAYVRAVSP